MRILNNVRRDFESLKVLDNINLEIEDNEIISIIGPSGCGKTTLLNILAGIDEDFQGEKVGFSGPISYLFQDLRLLPWKTVYENMAFVLKGKYPKEELSKVITGFLEKVNLLPYVNYGISEISGGMQQRLSLARAFAYPSKMLLMDEPFKSLDFEIRHHIIETFYEIWKQSPRTVIFVTHDIQSALMLSDRIVLLSKKPTFIAKSYKNTMKQGQRNIESEAFMKLEKTIYKEFMELC